jgi:hypothetical protein
MHINATMLKGTHSLLLGCLLLYPCQAHSLQEIDASSEETQSTNLQTSGVSELALYITSSYWSSVVESPSPPTFEAVELSAGAASPEAEDHTQRGV